MYCNFVMSAVVSANGAARSMLARLLLMGAESSAPLTPRAISNTMKIIQSLSIVALAVALTASASAFPYVNPTYTPVTPGEPAAPLASPKGGSTASSVASTTIAVSAARPSAQQRKAAAGKARLKSEQTR